METSENKSARVREPKNVNPDGTRHYFCRNCPVTADAMNLPKGWFIVRFAPTGDGMPETVGVYHEAKCLLVDVLVKELKINKSVASFMVLSHSS